ncbi:MAG: sigma-70 family RNA polymerase sigma factor [Myxococcota bacterium]|nr:sigma-70 family RNA polymerase sigma factor [Myxococcota bacterium]
MRTDPAPPDLWPGLDGEQLRRLVDEAVQGRTLAPELLEDLRLTRACALGNAAAITGFDALLREEGARAVRPLNAGLVEEVIQQLRERLLLRPSGGEPRILEFKAEGSLRAWLRVVAVRTALNLQRSEPPGIYVPPELAEDPLAASDPELELFRARYRDTFRAAFADAVAGLSVRDRAVLRLHTLEGLTLARIGTMYGKDTSTVSRWLEQIRRTLREATRTQLATRLALPPEELDSVVRAADLEISVSLARLLGG